MGSGSELKTSRIPQTVVSFCSIPSLSLLSSILIISTFFPFPLPSSYSVSLPFLPALYVCVLPALYFCVQQKIPNGTKFLQYSSKTKTSCVRNRWWLWLTLSIRFKSLRFPVFTHQLHQSNFPSRQIDSNIMACKTSRVCLTVVLQSAAFF